MSRGRDEKPFDIYKRTFAFAVEVISLCRALEARSWVSRSLGNQLLRAATSVGANMEEAQAAQSRRDFVSKCTIALKEAREARYWLRLLITSGIISTDEAGHLVRESFELANIIAAIVVRTRQSL